MEMTESFASAVASVAPVLLFAGTLEIVAVGAQMQRKAERRLAELQERQSRGEDLSGYDSLDEVLKPLRFSGFVILAWACFAMAQLVALGGALLWLAIPDANPHVSGVYVSLVALIGGTFWLIYFPIFRAWKTPVLVAVRAEMLIHNSAREQAESRSSDSAAAEG
ncbi:hypothetical protein [Streptomyces sp. NPDC059753]|uniref:hypothetical protein n=1 Tax=Streptomyces sp. NPDC059753 TaxID=3346933 RepID=UPI0036651AAA